MRPSDELDWDDLKLILALAEAGYVNRASERLRVDPTTIPRRLRRLEKRLGEKLVERIKGGVVLTATGNELVRVARTAEAGLNSALAPHSEGYAVSGLVKLSGTDFLLDLLAEELVALQKRFPDLVLDLRPTNDYLSIDRRETDVAIRVIDKPHDSLVGRRLPPIQLGVYAPPDAAKGGAGLPWLSWNLPRGVSEIDNFILAQEPDARIVARVDSFMSHARLATLGLGRTILPDAYVARHLALASLVRLGDAMETAAWVVTHEELRHVPRVGEVMAAVVRGLKNM
ncbi:LysR family transcriptional regulator [Yoonia sp. SDW83-1]|uniref:LysR family transcriptional regulator n=1 Tax=Yoonia sp. SDW83-1 TaxID=3366945 RepID=UPI00398C73DC